MRTVAWGRWLWLWMCVWGCLAVCVAIARGGEWEGTQTIGQSDGSRIRTWAATATTTAGYEPRAAACAATVRVVRACAREEEAGMTWAD